MSVKKKNLLYHPRKQHVMHIDLIYLDLDSIVFREIEDRIIVPFEV